MTLLRNLSIRWKVMHIIMFIMTVALLIACATFMTYDYITFRDRQITDSQALADLLGTSSTAALSFDDAQVARDTLKALSNKHEITRAHVYGLDGSEFALYDRTGLAPASLVPPGDGHGVRVTADRIGVFRPIVLNQERLGTSYGQVHVYLTPEEKRDMPASTVTIPADMAIWLACTVTFADALSVMPAASSFT